MKKNTLAVELKVGEEKLDRELFPAVRVRDGGARILVVAMEGKGVDQSYFILEVGL